MPYPRHMVENMKKEYGDKAGVGIAIATMKKHPKRYRKALKTARRRGHGGIIRSLARRKR